MKKFVLPIFAAIAAFAAGIGFDHSFFPRTKISPAPAIQLLHDESAAAEAVHLGPTIPPVPVEVSANSATSSSGEIIEKLQRALTNGGSRRAYMEFAKVADSLDANNARDVIAFAESLPNQQQ